ncbi:MAG: carbohydrate kinase family protein [Terriglobia bacterium]
MTLEKADSAGVVVLGDINVDVLGRLNSSEGLGADYLLPRFEMHSGGVGANTAFTLARWGVPVRLLGAVGRDWFGDLALGLLRREGVDVSLVQRRDHTLTGLVFVAVTPDGQRTMFGSRGANAEFHLPGEAGGYLEGSALVHLMGYNYLSQTVAEAAHKLVRAARKGNTVVSIDLGLGPCQALPDKLLQMARDTDAVFLSREEAAALTGEREGRRAFHALESAGIRDIVLKLGAQGCLFREHGELRHAPALSVQALDTTGAGDAFTATFLRAHLNRWPKEEAAMLANVAGAAAATTVGAGECMPGPGEVERLLASKRLTAAWEPVRMRVLARLGQEAKGAAPVRSEGGQNGVKT